MRWLGSLLASALTAFAATASAAPASDPAFLGVGMTSANGFCSVQSITPHSPAQEAGLMFGDAIYAFDNAPLAGPRAGPAPCDTLTNRIVAHRPGDEVVLDVQRGAQRLKLKATLSTRADVLSRRFVGEPMLRTDLEDIDNDKLSYDLGGRQGKTTIVGWFMLDRCTNCGRVFDRIADGLRVRLKELANPPAVLGVTEAAPRAKLASIRKAFTSSVSLALADAQVFDELALKDSLRISFMVIDCRGVVRFVAPVAPDSDDLDAAVDDILAAAVQAEHVRTRRL